MTASTKTRSSKAARDAEATFLLAAIVESSEDAIVSKDLAGMVTSWNKAAERMFGYAADEMVGESILKIIPGERQEEEEHILERLRSGDQIQNFETVRVRKDGERVEVSLTVSPVRDSSGIIIGASKIIREITERKRAEEAYLRLATKSEQQRRFYEAILSNTPDLVYVFGLDHRFTYANAALLKLWGRTSDEAIGKNCLELGYEPWHAAMHDREIEKVIATRQPIRGEVPFTGTHGRRVYDYIFVPVLGRHGEVEAIAGTTRDVTERKQFEESLRENEAVLRTVANEAQVGLVMVDKERRYLFANQTYADILGLPDPNIVGQRVPDVLAHLYDQIKPRLDSAFTGQRMSYELYLASHPKTGEERYYEVVYEPRLTHLPEGYVIVVLSDITQRKKIEHTLEQLVAQRTARLTETIGELEAFSYTIAHDMRAPLRAMQSFSAILDEEHAARLDEEGRGLLRRITLSASRLDHLIQDVLDYSKIVRADLQLEPVDTQALIEELIHAYPELQPQNADIVIDAPLSNILGNRAALTQVFANLLGNAAKFVAPGVRPRINIRTGPGFSGFVRLWFEDNGIGIEESFHKWLFQMFQRANPPGPYEGTGIGLAIVRKAIERMGGRVGVESQPGGGSRFWVELRPALHSQL